MPEKEEKTFILNVQYNTGNMTDKQALDYGLRAFWMFKTDL